MAIFQFSKKNEKLRKKFFQDLLSFSFATATLLNVSFLLVFTMMPLSKGFNLYTCKQAGQLLQNFSQKLQPG
jgi:hypothetical protein